MELRGEYARTPEAVIEAAEGADALLVQYADITGDVFEALPDLRQSAATASASTRSTSTPRPTTACQW